MTSKVDDVISPSKKSELLSDIIDSPTFLNRLSYHFASFLKVDRDLQKYRHLQMSFTYDLINVSLRRTINELVLKIL